RLRREPRPPLADVLRIGREIAEGLAAAHAAGLVHRDVKPANVWLKAPAGAAVLLDFGLARAAAGGGPTQPGSVLGTPAYRAREQANGHPTAPRADLFALGVVLYELAAGRRPPAVRRPVRRVRPARGPARPAASALLGRCPRAGRPVRAGHAAAGQGPGRPAGVGRRGRGGAAGHRPGRRPARAADRHSGAAVAAP